MTRTGSGPGSRGLVLAVVLAIGVGVAGIALVALTSDDDKNDEPAASATTKPRGGSTTTGPASSTTIDPDKLSAEAREFLALAAKGTTASFHARYEAEPTADAPSDAAPYSLVLELWNKPPNIRRSVSLTAQGSTILSSEFQDEKAVIRCGKPRPDQDWSCVATPIGSGPQEPGSPGFGLAPGVAAGTAVTATTRTVAEQEARCFSVESATAGADPDELCLSPDGIPLEFTSAGSRLKLTTLELSVNDPNVFEPPARPIGS
jgi:hypothetical protein